MEDEGLPWSSPKKVSDRFARNGEDMLEVLVNDIDRYEQLSNREELLALASALAGRGVIFEEVPLDHVDSDSVVNLEQCDAAIHVQNPEDLLLNNSNEVNDGRYKAVTISDTEQFILANRNANTRTKTKSDLKMFYEWVLSNGEMRMVEDVPFPELDGLLARFYLGVRRRDGEEYEPDTLSGVQNSIDRHLKDLKINVDIKKHEAFSHSRRVLEAKRKDLKSQGKGNKKNRVEPLDSDEIQKLYEKQVLRAANPNALLNTVWLNNGVHYGFRGRQEHTNLRLGDLKLLKDGSGTEYVEFYERTTKTRTGAKSGDVRDVTPKMFAQPDSDYCPVKLFKLYVSKRLEDLRSDPESRFYLRHCLTLIKMVFGTVVSL
ncbi:Hypothetical predicted protein [Mytilus galloprovincialis]|uniref:ZMYM2-like/QRICH1 C-terminal domain-containing protein n=1 Tax=Mytilus galloprovincialis TaxID=29158 RepID=A0A8B6BNC1_MYTGA|nr:Hypothetical predicted protein [Mytilus galloprovincialis]VDI25574.1 Hypothetical predicted protein [Mytilus galloprovincialis]